MLWKLAPAPPPDTPGDPLPHHGRFILHRHTDAQGPHLDLRLEAGPCLVGWRVDGADLLEERWAVEKPPHPLHWLEQNGDAVRDDAGTYAWIEHDDRTGLLELRGENSMRRLHVEQQPGLPPAVAGTLAQTVQQHKLDPAQLPQLVLDGRAARDRALTRLCALGRELDGTTFEEASWRGLLRDASLDAIHQHLRAYEVRFDARYPPAPVSQPEPLPDETDTDRQGAALAILQRG